MSFKKFFNLENDRDIAEIHKILFDSDSEGDNESEEDAIIPDFRENTENQKELLLDNFTSLSQPQSAQFETSDSSEDENPTAHANENRASVSNEDKLLVVNAPSKLLGKDRFKWSGKKGKLHGTPKKNLIVHLPGNRREAKNIKSGLEAWKLCFTEENLKWITEFTNKEIVIQRMKYRNDRSPEDKDVETSVRPSFSRDTNETEILALIGLLYYAGVMKMKGVSTKELFDKDSGIPIFRATMSESRFRFLLNCIRFDDKETRNERKKSDKLAAFREVFEGSFSKMNELYVPSEFTTIDEQLVGFRGRCPFKMYIPSKPDKYGIKILMCCDSKTFYALSAEIYTGRGSTPENVPASQYYCEKLTASFHGTNRNLTTDNWFTSVKTSQQLLEKKITVVGTLRKNKKEIPPLFLEVKERRKNSAMFAYSHQLTLLSYCPAKKNKKIVLMLSTMHEKGDEANENKNLPDIIQFYNDTKGGVDTLDQLCHTYSCSRKTRRWPLCLFYNLLNIIGINGMILLNGSNTREKEIIINRRLFLKELAMALVRPHMMSRLNTPTLPRHLRETICRVLKMNEEIQAPNKPEQLTGRCAFCTRSQDRKSRVKCSICKKFVCLEHQKKICPNCG
ncbi:piggyBac transposable element-derived protein 1-like [Harmonia axyridis]|uniref:piggyBac transposable element-derived protein 1-like n=1 Tax=Harmonia axyridis TaxID=115357 RepID=UPI001E2795F3|nr:piggyBac transposable element-derived protein 1-like [Harmonia axyridis]